MVLGAPGEPGMLAPSPAIGEPKPEQGHATSLALNTMDSIALQSQHTLMFATLILALVIENW